MISGKDKGKSGVVVRAFPRTEHVIIDGVNVSKRHQRARRANQKGQILDIAMPLHVSNVMIADPKTGKPTRISVKKVNGKYTRTAKKSGATL